MMAANPLPISVDLQEAERFLKLLDPTTDKFTFQTFDDVVLPDGSKRGLPELASWRHGTLATHSDHLIRAQSRGAGVFVMVQAGDGTGRNNAAVQRIRALFQEDDGEGQKLPVEPHIVVESSPNKYHRYLKLEGVDKPTFSAMMEVMIGQYGSDKNVKDLARVLRLPGFFHQKGEPFMVRIVGTKDDLPDYGADVLGPLTTAQPQAEPERNDRPAASAQVNAAVLAKVRKIAMDAANRTHDSQSVGRHSEIYKIGCYMRRDGLPGDSDTFTAALQIFSDNMRETNTTGHTAPMNWGTAMKALTEGYWKPAGSDWQGTHWSDVVDVPLSAESVQLFTQKPIPANFSDHWPGVLGIVTDWINATSRKPQPDFAMQAALAFGSTVLGRRYVTTQRNWPSLYFLNIGKSASGKEHAKWAIEQLLDACQLPHLIGPSGYTSDSGVLSTLHHQPCHISIIDEFGKTLEGASIKHGARAASTMKALMEVWGRCDGTIRPQGYSTFAMNASEIQRLTEKSVRNPALTLLAMTTPETFYESVGSAAARDGFLNRFLMVESDIGRQAGQHVEAIEIPEAVTAWAKWAHGEFSIADMAPMPTPTVVPFDADALRLFRDFEHECIGLMDEHEDAGLAEMFGRCNEIGMRISLVLALGCRADSIGSEHAGLAIKYVRHHFKRVVHRLATVVADSEFEGLMKQVLEMIRLAGARGLTERELNQRSRKFRIIDKRQKINVLDTLVYNGDISRCEFPPASGRGGSRIAWVAVDDVDIPET